MGRYWCDIDANGISGPDFPTILANLTADYLSAFGSDVYLGADTQDGQWIGIQALGYANSCAAQIAVFNAMRPGYAQGKGLSSIVKINGITRKVPTLSTVVLTIVGKANITITNGQVTDNNQNTWVLPASVDIPSSGTVDVTAACSTLGAVTAAIGTVVTIKTPTYGWQTVTNAAVAIPGQPVETDGQLRQRQGTSVSQPSVTIFEGIVSNLLNTNGVTRVTAYENNTNSALSNGLVARTLWFIVEGGASADILNAIAIKIPPARPTAGAQSGTSVSPNGSTRVLAWDIATPAAIAVNLTVKQQTGWSNTTIAQIQAAVSAYINTIPGNSAVVGFLDLIVPAKLENTPQFNTFRPTAIQINKNAGSFSAADITLAAAEMPTCIPANVNVTVT